MAINTIHTYANIIITIRIEGNIIALNSFILFKMVYIFSTKKVKLLLLQIVSMKYNLGGKQRMNIGIDLGTSNSVISICDENGKVTVIPNLEGKLTTPSIVHYDGSVFTVGEKVKPLYKLGDPNTVGIFKVDMGSSKTFELGGKSLTPKDLSSEVLRYLKTSAEKHLGKEIKEAVITVPAYFTELQRAQTREAGEAIGLKVSRIINEPTASALAFGIDLTESQTILVYDLGGGTFDVSLLTVGDDAVEVIATKGDNRLGGNDFDKLVANTILKSLKKLEGYQPTSEKVIRVMTELGRKAKEELSSNEFTEIDLGFIQKVDPSFKNKTGSLDISRENFNAIVNKLLLRTIQITLDTVAEAGMTMEEIDKIILVGGSTKSPVVKELLEKHTKRPVIQNEVDPDLIVSVGASIQASILSGSNTDMVLLDVTPLNLSIETVGGLTSVLIKANTAIPIKRSKTYTTSRDNQEEIEIYIYQGNEPIAKENQFLGEITLTGIKPAPAGQPQIEVTFKLNENGELEVTATDIMTFKSISTKRTIDL